MNKEYQFELDESWDVVLYYIRTITTPPVEPKFEDVKQKYAYLNTDELLDVFSELKSHYQKELVEYEKIKVEGTIQKTVFFTYDKYFVNNVKNFEKNSFFVQWTDSSKEHIKETIIKLSSK